ncbi:hypothetical protein C3747_145g126 [Trypanosoma cruzi]|uniref:Uncharacterized protein n=1 Tax=Trypanosoma cruzi TaxID=5693 RepID=A0A2V2W7X2_TRYCR|nr:hypothetical protein C3747_145g126 [Trypanosoma cruzi]
MRRCLVAPDLMSIDVDFLSDVLQASDYTGDCDAGVGMELLRASLWSLYTTLPACAPTTSTSLRPCLPISTTSGAAVLHCLKNRRGIRIQPRRDARGPLTPLETFVALMPTEATLPASVAQALRSSRKYETIAQQLFTSNDAAMVADAAKQAVEVAGEFLMVSEQCLRDFTSPVQLNVLQPPRRLSRHEQHRMLASKGRIERENQFLSLNVSHCRSRLST